MTKEALELAKCYDSDIRAINKALKVLYKPMLIVHSGITADDFALNELDSTTSAMLRVSMRETLEARKQELIEKLERL